MVKKAKKHTVLGGIKVSSSQLSEWGKSGGRPKKYQNNAERAKTFRLRKKQERLGKGVELRGYCVKEKKVEFRNSLEMVCSKCGAESIGGSQHLGEGCYRVFCEGRMGVK